MAARAKTRTKKSPRRESGRWRRGRAKNSLPLAPFLFCPSVGPSLSAPPRFVVHRLSPCLVHKIGSNFFVDTARNGKRRFLNYYARSK